MTVILLTSLVLLSAMASIASGSYMFYVVIRNRTIGHEPIGYVTEQTMGLGTQKKNSMILGGAFALLCGIALLGGLFISA